MHTLSTKLWDVSSTVDSESALDLQIFLSQAQAPLLASWPDRGPEGLRSPSCELATKNQTNKTQYLPLNIPRNIPLSVILMLRHSSHSHQPLLPH
ncbi:hypothetical protein PoB_001996400 [Plakobranchus ocellatus]|uniref:Uncharacterized protein n=1 Tax=Plakobranchus ocellatus TaxID=259542 RepID=A0AAV3ZHV8_9GAST|nr:hypothetical protein PoB_001996400 [Plakobranchus ocellatus]